MVKGLRDGIIDFVATDHAPHTQIQKMCTFDDAAFGISGLETALGSLMVLVHDGRITLPILIERLTTAPARFLGRHDMGTLREGVPADVTILDPDTEWVVEASRFASKGKNTPLDGLTLKGQVVATIVGGEVEYSTVNIDE